MYFIINLLNISLFFTDKLRLSLSSGCICPIYTILEGVVAGKLYTSLCFRINIDGHISLTEAVIPL
jgi:hypothetical protein